MAGETPQISFMDKVTNNIRNISVTTNNAIDKLKNLPRANIEAGIYQLKQGNFYDASIRFRIAAWLDKNNYIAHYLVGKALVYNGKRSKAIKHLRTALNLAPDLEEAKFLLAICGGGNELTHLPRSFIIERNDILAQNYEEIFRPYEETTFRKKLKAELNAYFEDWQGFDVLDLGAMGGDSGVITKNKANHLVGVEPSIKLAAFAKNRRINDNLAYNKVAAKFPEDYLAETEEKYQVIISTYYINNIGNPLNFFSLVRSRISLSGGVFIFAITPCKDAEFKFSTEEMIFKHSETFIEKCLTEAGFTVYKKSEVQYESGSNTIIYLAEAE